MSSILEYLWTSEASGWSCTHRRLQIKIYQASIGSGKCRNIVDVKVMSVDVKKNEFS